MDFPTLLGAATGLGLAAGLRLYATVLAIRFRWIQPDPPLDSLRALADERVLIVAGVAF